MLLAGLSTFAMWSTHTISAQAKNSRDEFPGGRQGGGTLWVDTGPSNPDPEFPGSI
jgi:hypothetical protein